MARQDDGDAGSNRPVRILGLIEWGLGHRTHGMNLGRAAQGLEDIDVTWHRLAAPTARAWCPDWTSNWTTQSGLMAGRYIHDARRSSATDIVFCHSYVPAVLGRSQLGRLPLVVSIDATPLQIDQMDGYEHSAGPATLERFKHLVVRRCFDRAVHVLAVSDWAKTGLVDGYGVPEDKITTIPFGVQIDRFVRPEGRQRNRSDVTRLLFVGGEFDRKGGPLLLSVFDELRSRHRIELDIVTDDAISVPPGVASTLASTRSHQS
ncbi:MAG: glycosyltransferase [Acidimicrobiales bacterium]